MFLIRMCLWLENLKICLKHGHLVIYFDMRDDEIPEVMSLWTYNTLVDSHVIEMESFLQYNDYPFAFLRQTDP